jgi:adenylylsulfate kinase
MSFAVWLTGLSGSGKSAVTKALLAQLHARRVEASVLESDVMRTQLTPFAGYGEAERDFFYGALAQVGAQLVARGRPVIFDATANRRAYRERARASIARFAEVFVDTPLEVCAARDPKGLYRAAREGRSATLPGMQSAYEPPLAAELVIQGDRGTPQESAARIVALLDERGWLDEAVIFADREGVIRSWNARAEAALGYTAAEAIGQSLDLIIPEHLRAAHWRGYHAAIEAGRTRHGGKAMATRATHKDGSKVYLEVSFGIVSGTQGALGAIAIARVASRPAR